MGAGPPRRQSSEELLRAPEGAVRRAWRVGELDVGVLAGRRRLHRLHGRALEGLGESASPSDEAPEAAYRSTASEERALPHEGSSRGCLLDSSLSAIPQSKFLQQSPVPTPSRTHTHPVSPRALRYPNDSLSAAARPLGRVHSGIRFNDHPNNFLRFCVSQCNLD